MIKKRFGDTNFFKRAMSNLFLRDDRSWTYLSRTSTDRYVNCLGNDGGSREAFKICRLYMQLMAKFENKCRPSSDNDNSQSFNYSNA
jgi:hypothetical protein